MLRIKTSNKYQNIMMLSCRKSVPVKSENEVWVFNWRKVRFIVWTVNSWFAIFHWTIHSVSVQTSKILCKENALVIKHFFQHSIIILILHYLHHLHGVLLHLQKLADFSWMNLCWITNLLYDIIILRAASYNSNK